MYVLAHQFFGANAPLIEILTEYDKVTNSLNKIIIEFLTLRISFKNRKLCFTRKSQLLIGLFIYYIVETRCVNKDVKSLTLYPFRYVVEQIVDLHNLMYDEMYIWYSDAYTCYMCKVT